MSVADPRGWSGEELRQVVGGQAGAHGWWGSLALQVGRGRGMHTWRVAVTSHPRKRFATALNTVELLVPQLACIDHQVSVAVRIALCASLHGCPQSNAVRELVDGGYYLIDVMVGFFMLAVLALLSFIGGESGEWDIGWTPGS